MAWKLVNPNITNDPSYLEPQITDHETRITNNMTSLAQKAQQADLTQITKLPNDPSGTDDTSTLQALINGLTDGDTLTLKSGTYIVTSLTITKNNITIKGKNTIVQCKNIIGSYSPFVSVSGTNVKIENVTFELNNKACYGVAVISGSENVRLENCTVQNGYNDGTINSMVVGISIQDNSKRIYVNNCVIKNMIATANGTIGDNIGASRAILVNSSVSTNLSSNVFITNCKIDNIQPLEDGDGIQVTCQSSSTFSKVVIEKCTFTNCAKRFVKSNVQGTIIRDNEMINATPSTDTTNRTDSMFSAISIYNGFVDVIGNNIHGNGWSSVIDMDLGSSASSALIDSVRIINNVMSTSESGVVTTLKGVIQIYAQVRNMLIKDNKIIKGTNSVYVHGDIDGLVISGNIMLSASNIGLFLDDYQTTNSVNVSITNNVIKSSNNAVVVRYGTATASGNVLGIAGGFGAFGYQNNNGLTRSGNTGYGAFGTTVNYGTSLPSLRSTTFDYGHEGALFVVSNTGVHDKLYVCVKKQDDTYAWRLIPNSVSGSVTYNGDGTSTSKTIAHGLGVTPTYYHVERASSDAGTAGIKYVTADATNITVYFNTAPVSGTNNVTLIWKAEI